MAPPRARLLVAFALGLAATAAACAPRQPPCTCGPAALARPAPGTRVTTAARPDQTADPALLAAMLSNPALRAAAVRRLGEVRQSVFERSRARPGHIHDAVVATFGPAIPALAAEFIAHPEDRALRREALEIFVVTHDPRALPALAAALDAPDAADPDGALTQRAATLLADFSFEREVGDELRARVGAALTRRLRRIAPTHRGLPARRSMIVALGGFYSADAVDPIAAVVDPAVEITEPGAIDAACEALDLHSDDAAADALVRGHILQRMRGDPAVDCLRALASSVSDRAGPQLVTALLDPAAVAAPLGLRADGAGAADTLRAVSRAALEALAAIAPPESADALTRVLADRARPPEWRALAAEGLVRLAFAEPHRRAEIFAALARALGDGSPARDVPARPWMAPHIAPLVAHSGDPVFFAPLLRAVRDPALRRPDRAGARARLLLDLATLARHGDVPAVERESRDVRAALLRLRASNHPDAPRAGSLLASLDDAGEMLRVARECRDGDVDCYRRELRAGWGPAARKASLLIAWTAPAARRREVRVALALRLWRRQLADDPLEPQEGEARRVLLWALEAVCDHDESMCTMALGGSRFVRPPSDQSLREEFFVARMRSRDRR